MGSSNLFRGLCALLCRFGWGLAEPFERVPSRRRPNGRAALFVASPTHRVDIERTAVVAVVVFESDATAIGARVLAGLEAWNQTVLDGCLDSAMRAPLPVLLRISWLAPPRVILGASGGTTRRRFALTLSLDPLAIKAVPSLMVICRAGAIAALVIVFNPRFPAAGLAIPTTNASAAIRFFRSSACAARLVLIRLGHDLGRLDCRVRDQVSVAIERARLQLKSNLEERPFRDCPILRPHVDGVTAGVAEGGGQFDGRTEECNCLSSSDHAPMLNPFSDFVQAHLAAQSLKFFT
jgi:hypothetical protein